MAVHTFMPGQSNSTSYRVREALMDLRIGFKNPTGNLVNVTNPKGRLLQEGVVVQNLVMVTGSQSPDGWIDLVNVSTGTYAMSLLPTGLKPGYYTVEFQATGVFGSQTLTYQVGGAIGIGELSMLQYYINAIRIRLMDDMVEWYRVDEPVQQWPANTLFTCMNGALSHINISPPQVRYETFDTVPEDLIMTGALIYALEARARLEIANDMSYSDGHTLTIERSSKYMALANQMRQAWQLSIESWKKSTPPTPIALQSQRLPFRIFRVIGMLPNYQSYFEGLL